jgi:hypothetical protein
MNQIETSFRESIKKIEYIFKVEFKKDVNLLLMEFYPEFDNGFVESYEIQLEFDILEDIDPDLDYIFGNIKEKVDKISNFFHEYSINNNGKLKYDKNKESFIPVVHGIDYLFGDKFIVKTFFKFSS